MLSHSLEASLKTLLKGCFAKLRGGGREAGTAGGGVNSKDADTNLQTKIHVFYFSSTQGGKK